MKEIFGKPINIFEEFIGKIKFEEFQNDVLVSAIALNNSSIEPNDVYLYKDDLSSNLSKNAVVGIEEISILIQMI